MTFSWMNTKHLKVDLQFKNPSRKFEITVENNGIIKYLHMIISLYHEQRQLQTVNILLNWTPRKTY